MNEEYQKNPLHYKLSKNLQIIDERKKIKKALIHIRIALLYISPCQIL